MSDSLPERPERQGTLWDRLVRLVTPNPPRGQFFGALGERAQLELTVDQMREVGSGGVLHTLRDADGRRFVWLNDGEASGMEAGRSYRVNATILDHNIAHNVRETHIHRVGPASAVGLPEADPIPELMPSMPAVRHPAARSHGARYVWFAIGMIVLLGGAVLAIQTSLFGVMSTPTFEQAAPTAPAPKPTDGAVQRPAAAPAPSPVASPAASPSATPGVPLFFVTGGEAAGVSLRSAPATTAPRLAVLTDGTALEDRTEERQADGRLWRKVAQIDGAEGWVAAEFLTTIRPAFPPSSPVPGPAGSPSPLFIF
jgi:hypothetical protein